MAIFTFVLGAALSLFEIGVKSAPKEQERAAAIPRPRPDSAAWSARFATPTRS